MKNFLTILKRELRIYSQSVIGYIFIVVFLAISVGLFMTPFFTFPRADMRSFFNTLPFIMCVFIPAITMRLWAEERTENTWEMLLTFPISSYELVLGKFAGALIFFMAALAGTATVPLMLSYLGHPDMGPIIGAYTGTVLLGGFFLAMGIFISGMCKDQIVAFVVTLLACFAVFLLGTDFIAAYIDGIWGGLGSTLAYLLGVTGHFQSFARGVLEISDILFFVTWIAIFLFLNSFYIEGRDRPKARSIFAGTVAVSFIIGMLFNWVISDMSFGRFDLTEGKIYTVSDASKNILAKLSVPVRVNVYISPKGKMPTAMSRLEQDIKDKLDEMRIASGGKVQYKTIHMEAANVLGTAEDEKKKKGDKGEDAIEKRLLKKGIKPFSVQAIQKDEVTNKLVYSAIGVAYKDKTEEIIPQVVPQNIRDLEYNIINIVYKVTREKQPLVAIVAPKEAVNIPPNLRKLYMQMGQQIPQTEDLYIYLAKVLEREKYKTVRVDLTQDSPIPDEADTIAIVNPRGLNERQRWEIARLLLEGKSVFMAVQNYEWNYTVRGRGIAIKKSDQNPGVNDLLRKYGLEVDRRLLMDVNHQPLTVTDSSNPFGAMMGRGMTLNLPIQISVNQPTMNTNVSISNRLSSIFYLWGSALKINSGELKSSNLNMVKLFSTTGKAWQVSADKPVTQATFQEPTSGFSSYPLAVMVTGQFSDVFKGKPRPEWPAADVVPGSAPKAPKAEKPITAPKPAPGKLILMGCSQMFSKNFLSRGNLDLFLNSIDAITLGDDLVNVRSKKAIDRGIEKPSDGTKTFWKFINLWFINLLIVAIGVLGTYLRRKSRDAYTTAQN